MIYMIRIGLLLSVPPVFQTPTPAWPSQVYLPFPHPKVPSFVFFRLESVFQVVRIPTNKINDSESARSSSQLHTCSQQKPSEVPNHRGRQQCERRLCTLLILQGDQYMVPERGRVLGEGSGGLTGSPTFPDLLILSKSSSGSRRLCPLSCFINFYQQHIKMDDAEILEVVPITWPLYYDRNLTMYAISIV